MMIRSVNKELIKIRDTSSMLNPLHENVDIYLKITCLQVQKWQLLG